MKGEFSSFHYAWITSIIIFLVMLFVIPIIASFFDRVSNIGAFKKKLENFVKTFVKVVSVLFLVFLVFGYIDYQSCGSKFGIAKTEDYADCLALRAYEDGVDLDYCKGIGRCEWRLSNLVANSGFLGESVEFCKNYDKQIIDKYGKDPNGQNSAGEMYEGAFLTANSCYSALAQYNDDEAYCFEIDDVLAKDMCFSNLADRRKDPSLCENVVSKQRSLYDTMTAKEKCIRRANLQ